MATKAKAKSKTKEKGTGSGKRGKKLVKKKQTTIKRKTTTVMPKSDAGRTPPRAPGQEAPAKGPVPGVAVPKAIEVEPVYAEPIPWVKRSTLSIKEIERKIDVMIAAKEPTRPLSIQDRYRERYGEELAIPEDYRKYEKLQLAEGDEDYLKAPLQGAGYPAPGYGLAPATMPASGPTGAAPEVAKEEPLALKGRKARKAAKRAERAKAGAGAGPKRKPDRKAKFFDMRTCRGYLFYLPAKYPEKGGFAKFIFVLLELLLYIFTFGILILIRVFTTLGYKRKDKKAAKRAARAKAEEANMESETEQPSPA